MTWVYLIPIVAILVGGFTEWLKFKEKQLKLGSTTDSLSGELDELLDRLNATESENLAMNVRIKNLEAIVTTQMWDDSIAAKPSRESLLELDDEPTDEEKAKALARRIRH